MSISINASVNPVAPDPNISSTPKLKSPSVDQPPRKNVLATEQSVSKENAAPPTELTEPNVTFRRDSNGQIYYVLTDAQTGEELRQLPPEEFRKVGEGIAEYLKREQEKQTPHVKLKA